MKTRALVVEYATMLEEYSAYCLCTLLNIDQNQSISFGYKGQSLSFNSKINLLSDIAGTDKLIKSKFQIFSEIRNKFAHVFSVSSFRALCDLDAEYKKSIKKILGWYIEEEYNKDTEGLPKDEIVFIVSFLYLYKDLEDYIINVIKIDQEKKGYEKGKFDSLIEFRDIISKELYNSNEGLTILSNYFEAVNR
jgi:hypothetical protein